MCIAIPMRVLEVRSESEVVVTRPGRTELADASFADQVPQAGDLVLVFRGTILRTVSQDEALKIESAKARTTPLPTSSKTQANCRRICRDLSGKRWPEVIQTRPA